MLSRNCLRLLFLVSLVLLIFAAAGCGGSERSAQLDQGAYTPQASGPLDIMPPSQMLEAQGNKSASALTLYLKGNQYGTKPLQRVVAQDDDAKFTPAWDANWSGFEGIAFSAYRLNVLGATPASVLHFGWTTPPTDLGDVWIGLSQWSKDRWVWFQAPADGTLELPGVGYSLYTKQGSGDLLVALVVLGNDVSLFHELWIGSSIPVHTISGYLKTGSGVGIADATVGFSGGLQSVITDATGYFVRDMVYDGTYTVTPTKTGCTFVPTYMNITVSGGDQGPVNFATAPSTASGYVRTVGGAGIPGVIMSFSGGIADVATDSTGHWQVGPLADGDYTVTPSKTGLTFLPASADFTMAGMAASVPDFIGSSNMVSGYVKTVGSQGIEGVTITFSGACQPVTTDSIGYWVAGPFPNGDYTATPSKPGFTFAPSNADFTMAGMDLILSDFIGDSNIASGYVKDGGGTGIANVTMNFTGGLVSVVTDANGRWMRDAIPDGNYTVTPVKNGYTFAPPTRDFTIASNDQPVPDFVGTGGTVIDILSVTTDKTTHCSDASEPPSQLDVVTDPSPADTYLWSGEGDFSSTTIANPTWKPNASTKLGKVTLTVAVTLGASNDSATIDLYVTGQGIKTSWTSDQDGVNRQIGNPPGSGIVPDYDMSAMQYLHPFIEGGDITAATGTFYEKIDGRAVLYDRWELS